MTVRWQVQKFCRAKLPKRIKSAEVGIWRSSDETGMIIELFGDMDISLLKSTCYTTYYIVFNYSSSPGLNLENILFWKIQYYA